MDELLEAAERVFDARSLVTKKMSAHMRLDELWDAIAELQTEVEIQRRRIATDESAERVEQP